MPRAPVAGTVCDDGLSTVHPFLEALRVAATRAALPLAGTVDVARYDAAAPETGRLRARYPGARSAVVLAQGGPEFWERFAAARAGWRRVPADPLDAWTRTVAADVVACAQASVPLPCRLLFPTDAAVDFRHLGRLAGLGVPSRLGMLMHPEFGSWLALRAAVLVPATLPPTPGLDAFAPCETCADRPCEAACPAAAVSERGWDAAACMAHRLRPDETCASGCHARLACPVGADRMLPEAARRHHQAAARGLMRPTRR